ncbi:MAG: PepSY domain-containing protein [Acidobacteriota bacterium]|nr:PepSY domain-containing protein [Acidobacteriota bacterium]
MKRNMMLVAVLTGTLVAGALTVPSTLRAQTTQDNHEVKQEKKQGKHERERNDRDDSDESQDQNELAKEAKITKEQAQEVALKRAPGTVESGELERERGKLVYSFDIRNSKGTIDEVQVSAISGKVVRVEHENAKQEAEEKRKEERERSPSRPKP